MKYIYVPLLFLFILFAGLSCQRAEKSAQLHKSVAI